MSGRTKTDLMSTIEKPYYHVGVIKNNTCKVYYKDNTAAIRYHDTDIITVLPDKSFILTSGGFTTPSTKSRLIEFSGIKKIWSKDHTWYLQPKEDVIEFYDGIKFDKNFNHMREQ